MFRLLFGLKKSFELLVLIAFFDAKLLLFFLQSSQVDPYLISVLKKHPQ
jgi:hypothetical protein